MRFSLGVSTSESCKDVDVVSELPDCSNSTARTIDSLDGEMAGDRRLKERAVANSRIRSQDDGSIDSDSGHDSASVSSVGFEFQKADRAPHRVPFASISKPAPSKWDDAEKWIASPVSNRPKAGQLQAQGGQAFAPRKTALGYGNRQSATKVVVEVPEQKAVAVEEVDTKRIDPSHGKMEIGGQKIVNWAPEPYPVADLYVKPSLLVESSVADSAGETFI